MDGNLAQNRSAVPAWSLVVVALLSVIASQQLLFVPVLRAANCFVPDQYRDAESLVAILLSFVSVASWLGAIRLSRGRRSGALVAGFVVLGLDSIATAAVVRFISMPPYPKAIEIRQSCGINEADAAAVGLLLLTPIVAVLAQHVLDIGRRPWSAIRWVLRAVLLVALWAPFLLVVRPFVRG